MDGGGLSDWEAFPCACLMYTPRREVGVAAVNGLGTTLCLDVADLVAAVAP